jgi:hypothetical protein
MVLCSLIRTGATLAAEPAARSGNEFEAGPAKMRPSQTDSPPTPGFGASGTSNAPSPNAPNPRAPMSLDAPALADPQTFSATEFRPRRSTASNAETGRSFDAAYDMPMQRALSLSEQMSDYRSHDRLQLLTLWETRGSTISIQAGKHGGPSLQWSSRTMSHGVSTRGLLDKLVSASLARAGADARQSGRASSAATSARAVVLGPPAIKAP